MCPDNQDETAQWPVQYPGLWRGRIIGASSAIGNNASPTKSIPIHNVVSRGSALLAWVYPDPDDAARILSASITQAKMSTLEMMTDGSFVFAEKPFKYTLGDANPSGRENWYNRCAIPKTTTRGLNSCNFKPYNLIPNIYPLNVRP